MGKQFIEDSSGTFASCQFLADTPNHRARCGIDFILDVILPQKPEHFPMAMVQRQVIQLRQRFRNLLVPVFEMDEKAFWIQFYTLTANTDV